MARHLSVSSNQWSVSHSMRLGGTRGGVDRIVLAGTPVVGKLGYIVNHGIGALDAEFCPTNSTITITSYSGRTRGASFFALTGSICGISIVFS